MPKKIIYHCRHCGKEIESDVAYKPNQSSKMYYCDEDCYIASQAKNKEKFKPTYGSEKRDLTDYIQLIYINSGFDKRTINWGMISKQIQNLLSNNPNWTYCTIQYILWYMNEVANMNLISEESHYNPLTLVEFYANEAENYYAEMSELDEYLSSFNFETETVKIKRNQNNFKHDSKFIDMSKVLVV